MLNPVLYEREGLRQLENTHYYTEINSRLANETVPRICAIIQELYDIGYLLDKQHAFLSPNVPAQAHSFSLSISYLRCIRIDPSVHIPTCLRAGL